MESTLSLTLDDIEAEVGHFLGYGRGANFEETAWTPQQQRDIDSVIKSGLRQFYFPPPIDGAPAGYDWSFLKPVASLTFASGDSTIPLPADFGGIEGQITMSAAASQISWPIDVVSDGFVRQKYAELPTSTGRPLVAAVQPLKETKPGRGQRFQLYLWPLADQAYTLRVAYYLTPDALTSHHPFPLGGMAHAETILQSCLSIAEQKLDDAMMVHTAKFKERLIASVNLDRRLKPQKLGYNRDRSDDRYSDPSDRHWLNTITYNGETS